MRAPVFLSVFILLFNVLAQAQNKTLGVGVGSPNPHAALHVESPTGNQGFIMPRLTTAQRTSSGFVSILSVTDNGLMVYDSDEKTLYIWDGTAWKSSQQVAQANIANRLVLPYVETTTSAPNNSNIIDIMHNGTGVENVGVAKFENLNPNNGFNPLFVRNYGLNGSAYFNTINVNSASTALRTYTNSNQANVHALEAGTIGTGGSGASFFINNAASTRAALISTTNGIGPASVLSITNASSASPVLSITHSGTGNAITANKPIQATSFIGDGSALTGITSTPGANSVSTGTIVDGTIVNADINAAAAIAGSKITPTFGAQNISTTGTLAAGATTLTGLTISGATSTLNTVPYTWPGTQGAASTVLTNNGSGTLTWSAAGGGLSSTLNSANLFVGNAGNVATGVALSGDATITNTGVLTIGTGAITSAKILDGSIVNADIANVDASKITTGTIGLTTGGTGATTAAAARTNLGLGTLSTASAVSTTEITDGTIANADINATAAIAGTKITPTFGAQNISTTGTATLGGGLLAGGTNQFTVNATGNITKINNIVTSFPTVQGTANTVLTNNGSGTLSWAAAGGFALPYSGSDNGASAALSIIKNGATGSAGSFAIQENTNPDNALSASTDGTGVAGYFESTGSGSALYALSNSGYGLLTVGVDGDAAIRSEVSGTGNGIQSYMPGFGVPGDFQIDNDNNNSNVLRLSTNGNGRGIMINLTASENASPGIEINHNGLGNAITTNKPIQASSFIGDGSLLTNISSGWGLTGNTGTVDGTDFIGTTDDVPLNFRVNNIQVGRIDPNGSLSFGQNAAVLNTASENVAIGANSLSANTTGVQNSAYGAYTMYSSTGNYNTALGYQALYALTSGSNNTAVGYNALSTPASGSNNTAIGSLSQVVGSLTNATAIGAGATVNASNKVRIGNAGVTVIEGQVAFTAASDQRLKTNIQNLNDGLNLIMKLRPVSYYMKNQSNPKLNWGFIAQDIEALVGEENAVITIGGDADRTLGLRYTDFIAPLVKAIQEQQLLIGELQQKLQQLEAKTQP